MTRWGASAAVVLGALLGAVLWTEVPVEPPTPRATADSAQDAPIELAVTLDDLPWVGPLPEGDDTPHAAVERIAAVLRVHEAPATGFVICDEAARQQDVLHEWVAWGNTLGNHSAAHRDLNTAPVGEWLADVRRCDEYLSAFGEAYRPFFRFPMLHQGATSSKRAHAEAGLDEVGLRTAHVTVDNSEWILAQAHARAVATEDAVLRYEVGRAFVRHVTAAVEHTDEVARRKLGRPVPQVLLLHANSLVADQLDALLLALRQRGVTFITLDEALADAAYTRTDEYVGPRGLSWLYRMKPLSVEDAYWDDAEARTLRTCFAGALNATDSVGASERYVGVKVPPGFEQVLAEAAASERMRSLLVMHRGELVVEAYFNGAGPEKPANLKSVTKTLASSLVGIALREGWVESVDDPIGRYLPERVAAWPDKAAITIRELLTMSSGLQPVDYGVIQQRTDWVATLLAQSLRDEARGTFAYDTPVLQLLTAVLEAASGRPVEELAAMLMEPFGGEVVYWRTDGQGLPLGGNDAYVRPRDLVRLGELFRRGGRFDGRQVVPADFARAATAQQIAPATDRVNHGTLSVRGYGYLWWLLVVDGTPAYAALGHGGQMLMVVPQRELVVLMTSRWPSTSSTAHYQHLTRTLVDGVLPCFPASGLPSGEPGDDS